MANKVAPKGQVYVCGACGKRSKDIYGDQKIDPGWDESCMLNSILCYDQPNEPNHNIRNQKWVAVKED